MSPENSPIGDQANNVLYAPGNLIRTNPYGFGIHSPFAYHLVARVLFEKALSFPGEKEALAALRYGDRRLAARILRLARYFSPELLLTGDEGSPLMTTLTPLWPVLLPNTLVCSVTRKKDPYYSRPFPAGDQSSGDRSSGCQSSGDQPSGCQSSADQSPCGPMSVNRLSDKLLPGQRPSDNVLPGQRPSDNLLPGQRPSDNLLPGQRPSDNVLPGQRPSDNVLPGQRPSGVLPSDPQHSVDRSPENQPPVAPGSGYESQAGNRKPRVETMVIGSLVCHFPSSLTRVNAPACWILTDLGNLELKGFFNILRLSDTTSLTFEVKKTGIVIFDPRFKKQNYFVREWFRF